MKALRYLTISAAILSLTARATSLNESFAVVKNFTNVFIHENETIYINLEDYFRGNFLTFTAEMVDTETGNVTSDSSLVNFMAPITPEVFSDFTQTGNQRSLPQTSLVYKDPQTNEKFLIFIDRMMMLNIYDLTNSLMNSNGENVPVIPAMTHDLSKPQ